VLTFPIALQGLEVVAGKCCKIGKAHGCIESIQSGHGLLCEAGEAPDLLTFSEQACPSVAVADDHVKLTPDYGLRTS
jgi:hypothetical protein